MNGFFLLILFVNGIHYIDMFICFENFISTLSPIYIAHMQGKFNIKFLLRERSFCKIEKLSCSANVQFVKSNQEDGFLV